MTLPSLARSSRPLSVLLALLVAGGPLPAAQPDNTLSQITKFLRGFRSGPKKDTGKATAKVAIQEAFGVRLGEVRHPTPVYEVVDDLLMFPFTPSSPLPGFNSHMLGVTAVTHRVVSISAICANLPEAAASNAAASHLQSIYGTQPTRQTNGDATTWRWARGNAEVVLTQRPKLASVVFALDLEKDMAAEMARWKANPRPGLEYGGPAYLRTVTLDGLAGLMLGQSFPAPAGAVKDESGITFKFAPREPVEGTANYVALVTPRENRVASIMTGFPKVTPAAFAQLAADLNARFGPPSFSWPASGKAGRRMSWANESRNVTLIYWSDASAMLMVADTGLMNQASSEATGGL